MEERDILVFNDEEGQEIQLEILDYFEHDDEEYVMLATIDDDEDEDEDYEDEDYDETHDDEHDHDHDCDHEHDHDCDDCHCGSKEKDIYLMKVVIDGDEEKYVPVDEDKMDELIETINDLYNDDDDEE